MTMMYKFIEKRGNQFIAIITTTKKDAEKRRQMAMLRNSKVSPIYKHNSLIQLEVKRG